MKEIKWLKDRELYKYTDSSRGYASYFTTLHEAQRYYDMESFFPSTNDKTASEKREIRKKKLERIFSK